MNKKSKELLIKSIQEDEKLDEAQKLLYMAIFDLNEK